MRVVFEVSLFPALTHPYPSLVRSGKTKKQHSDLEERGALMAARNFGPQLRPQVRVRTVLGSRRYLSEVRKILFHRR